MANDPFDKEWWSTGKLFLFRQGGGTRQFCGFHAGIGNVFCFDGSDRVHATAYGVLPGNRPLFNLESGDDLLVVYTECGDPKLFESGVVVARMECARHIFRSIPVLVAYEAPAVPLRFEVSFRAILNILNASD